MLRTSDLKLGDDKNSSLPESKYSIPKKIHFIWIGKSIPKKYLLTIHHLVALAKKSNYEINLWLDHKKNYYNTAYANEIDTPGLRIRLIQELIPSIETNPFYQDRINHCVFIKNVNREMVGFKNLAAASDWLRYEILRQEGGIYLDTDNQFLFDPDNNSLNPINAKFGFLIKGDGTGSIGNNIIAASKNNEIVCRILDNLIYEYKKLDGNESKSRYGKNLMDLKRIPYKALLFSPDKTKYRPVYDSKKHEEYHRRNLTLEASGPDAVWTILSKFIYEELHIGVFSSEERAKTIKDTFHFESDSKGNIKMAGQMIENTPYALSWIMQPRSQYAFDDNTFDPKHFLSLSTSFTKTKSSFLGNVSKYLNGERSLSKKQIAGLKKRFGISADFFVK